MTAERLDESQNPSCQAIAGPALPEVSTEVEIFMKGTNIPLDKDTLDSPSPSNDLPSTETNENQSPSMAQANFQIDLLTPIRIELNKSYNSTPIRDPDTDDESFTTT